MSDAKKTDLVMTFDPSTIEHLGIRMYSTLPHGVKFLGVEGVSPSDFEDRL